MAVESGRGELSRADSRRLSAETREAERVAQPLGGIDGNHRGIEIGGCARERERGGNRGLTDAASAEQNRNRALGEQALHDSYSPLQKGEGQGEVPLHSLPTIAGAPPARIATTVVIARR